MSYIGPVEAQRRYLDYYCNGNSLNTSYDQMGEIINNYGDQLQDWQALVSDDKNVYKFDDDEFKNWKAEGKESAKDKTGYKNTAVQKTSQIVRSTTSAAAGGAMAVRSVADGGINSVNQLMHGNIGFGTERAAAKEAAQQAAEEAASESLSSQGVTMETASAKQLDMADNAASEAYDNSMSLSESDVSAGEVLDLITAGLVVAKTAEYMINKPNEKQVDACNEMMQVMTDASAELADDQNEMAHMAQEIDDASAEAEDCQSRASETIESDKSEYDLYAKTRERIKAKAESGQALSESERALYRDSAKIMTQNSNNINETIADTSETVKGIQSDMGTYQEGYDGVAESAANITGQAEYAAGFDKTTERMCIVEGVAQGANAVSGVVTGAKLILKGAAKLGVFGIVEIVAGTAAAAAGVKSGFDAVEQFGMSKQAGAEVETRMQVQDLTDATLEMYDTEVQNYEVSMSAVGELEVAEPDNIDIPSDTKLPETQADKDKSKLYGTLNLKKEGK